MFLRPFERKLRNGVVGSIFLSYTREDVGVAEAAAAALERAGLSVWWDRRLSGGSEYSREIEKALRESDAVVVLWSKSSVDSPWVRDEAAKGRDAGKLIPATIDGTEPPLGFGQFHTIDLSRRRVGRKRSMTELVAATRQKLAQPDGGGGASAASAASSALAPPLFRPAMVFGIVALVGVVIAAAYLLYDAMSGSEPRGPAGGRVVIAGFDPVSNDPESGRVAQLAAGAVERTLATNFIETIGQSASAGAGKGADFRLEGTVDRDGEQLTILTNVVDPSSGRTLWSTEVARPPDESRQLTEELAILVADVIRCSTYTKRRMPKYDSAEVYSRIFRSCEAERSSGEQYEQLPAVSQALVDVAPQSAQAWAYLANTTAFVFGEQRRQQVHAAARKALELDPKNGAVRWGIAILPDPKVTLARRERLLREGLRLDPEFLWHRNHLAHLMRKVGRTEEAAALYEEFVANYPLDIVVRTHSAYLRAQAGWMTGAREEFDRIAQVRPWYRGAPFYAARAEILFGDPSQARRWMDAMALSDHDRRCAEITVGALESNRKLTAAQIDQGCRGGLLRPEQVFAKFGHTDEAFAILEEESTQEGVATQGPWYVYEPDFAAVRADPRFIPFLARFGIPQYWLETNRWPDFCREDDLPYDCREAASAAVASART